jgi:hypothetical protein
MTDELYDFFVKLRTLRVLRYNGPVRIDGAPHALSISFDYSGTAQQTTIDTQEEHPAPIAKKRMSDIEAALDAARNPQGLYPTSKDESGAHES